MMKSAVIRAICGALPLLALTIAACGVMQLLTSNYCLCDRFEKHFKNLVGFNDKTHQPFCHIKIALVTGDRLIALFSG